MSRNFYLANDIELLNNSYTPDDNVKIFRYMDFSKYVDLLERKKLCFCNAKKFEDKFEGEMPEAFYHNWSEEHKNGHKSISEELEKYFSCFISCWNMGEGENYALWKIYTKPETGVCIKTSVGRLRKALNNEDIKIYVVKYIPSFNDSSFDIEFPHYMRMQDGFSIKHSVKEVCKLDAYKYENEVRAVFVEKSREKSIIQFSVNLEELIDEVYLSPYASTWFKELVKRVTLRKRELKKSVNFIESRIRL